MVNSCRHYKSIRSYSNPSGPPCRQSISCVATIASQRFHRFVSFCCCCCCYTSLVVYSFESKKKINVQLMRRSSDGPLKLYVGDLGENKKSDLTRLFSKYGTITSIYCDEYKHFAFIEFTSSDDAQRALERTNQKIVNGSKLRVEFAKSDRPTRRDRSPTSMLYSHLQVTANRLPPMQVFRQTHQHHPPSSMSSSSTRGRSLTPPSMKYLRIPNEIPPRHSMDPYTAQRLPPSAFQRSQRSKPKEKDRFPSPNQQGKKRKRRKSSSSSSSSTEEQVRGPRTPPPRRKRSRSKSDAVASTSDDEEEKQSTSTRRSIETTDSTRKHSKRKSRE